MQLCEEYGTKLFASPDSNGHPDSSLVTNLIYTQALILLGIPGKEREEFIGEHDVGEFRVSHTLFERGW